MPYNECLANQLRKALATAKNVEEKKMFRGICFMVNGKMCICVSGDELLCRIDPLRQNALMEKPGCRQMIRLGKPMSGFIYVDHSAVQSKKDFDFWLNLCLAFNTFAKPSKKKKAKVK